jgi:hypothetical protein
VIATGMQLGQGAAVLLTGLLADRFDIPTVVGLWSLAGTVVVALLVVRWPSAERFDAAIAAVASAPTADTASASAADAQDRSATPSADGTEPIASAPAASTSGAKGDGRLPVPGPPSSEVGRI